MSEIFSINIRSEDIINKRYKPIGCGTDGLVLRLNKDYLLKVYHNKLKYILDPNLMSYQTKIYEGPISFVKPKNSLMYYEHSESPDEDIRIYSKDALGRAIDRQKNIQRTKLPVGALYIDNVFSGAVLKASKGIQIHKLIGLPLGLRKKIMLSVLEDLRELLDNYIYQEDLSNSPYGRSILIDDNQILHSVGHSHVLVNPFTLETNIIDLDGKSTIYMERYSEEHEKNSIDGMLVLLLEFLLQIDLEEQDVQELYNEFIEKSLKGLDIQDEFLSKFQDESLKVEDLIRLTKSYK